VVATNPYGKTIQEEAGCERRGLQECHYNKRGRSTGAILVPSRLALGADADASRYTGLYAGLAGGIYLG